MKKGVVVLIIFTVFVVGIYLYRTANRLPINWFPSGGNNQVEISPNETFGGQTDIVDQGQIGDQQSLPLTITQPRSGAVVSSPNLTVVGKTAANAEVFVNDSSLLADSQGNFSALVTLDEGDNTIIIVANDAAGNFAEKEIVVTLQTQ